MQRSDIHGWGADAPLENRPGVPEELDPPHPFGNMSLGAPAQQTRGEPSVKSTWRPLTPVYSSAVPPRGLSGLIRKAAYRLPDYKARRWMLLLLADRIDVIEHNVRPAALIVGALALGLFGLSAVARARR